MAPKQATNKRTLNIIKKSIPNKQAFPEKLFEILQNESHEVISWSSSGMGFFICQMDKFINQILLKYFRHHNFASFQRQLNLYGFRKLIRGPEAGCYHHQWFQRSSPDLLQNIQRAPQTIAKKNQPKRKKNSSILMSTDSESEFSVTNRKKKKRVTREIFSVVPVLRIERDGDDDEEEEEEEEEEEFQKEDDSDYFDHDENILKMSTQIPESIFYAPKKMTIHQQTIENETHKNEIHDNEIHENEINLNEIHENDMNWFFEGEHQQQEVHIANSNFSFINSISNNVNHSKISPLYLPSNGYFSDNSIVVKEGHEPKEQEMDLTIDELSDIFNNSDIWNQIQSVSLANDDNIPLNTETPNQQLQLNNNTNEIDYSKIFGQNIQLPSIPINRAISDGMLSDLYSLGDIDHIFDFHEGQNLSRSSIPFPLPSLTPSSSLSSLSSSPRSSTALLPIPSSASLSTTVSNTNSFSVNNILPPAPLTMQRN